MSFGRVAAAPRRGPTLPATKIRQLFKNDNGYGKKLTLGEKNPYKTFYVIRTEAEKWGALTTWIMLMPHVAFSLKKGFIPIFAMLIQALPPVTNFL